MGAGTPLALLLAHNTFNFSARPRPRAAYRISRPSPMPHTAGRRRRAQPRRDHVREGSTTASEGSTTACGAVGHSPLSRRSPASPSEGGSARGSARCSGRRLGVRHHLEQALHRGGPSLERALQPAELLLPKLALEAARDDDGGAHLVHLCDDEPRRDGLDHPVLHLVRGDAERLGDRRIRELLVRDAERGEREQPHLALERGGVETLRLEEGRVGRHRCKLEEVARHLARDDVEQPGERGELGVRLEGGGDRQLGERVAGEQRRRAQRQQHALDQPTAQLGVRRDVFGRVQREVLDAALVGAVLVRAGVGVERRVEDEPPQLSLLRLRQLPRAHPVLDCRHPPLGSSQEQVERAAAAAGAEEEQLGEHREVELLQPVPADEAVEGEEERAAQGGPLVGGGGELVRQRLDHPLDEPPLEQQLQQQRVGDLNLALVGAAEALADGGEQPLAQRLELTLLLQRHALHLKLGRLHRLGRRLGLGRSVALGGGGSLSSGGSLGGRRRRDPARQALHE
mmetsp:Transcript_36301/g.119620  ORF Transcript_36301/g.119620 Transcript_36301/m.119620 type:complete len:513 (+) Transcript_36301:35-1573(+)